MQPHVSVHPSQLELHRTWAHACMVLQRDVYVVHTLHAQLANTHMLGLHEGMTQLSCFVLFRF